MQRFLTGTTSALALTLLALPAAAQVTPSEVWQNWQDAATASGYAITGAQVAEDGATLTVTGAVLSIDAGDGSKVDVPVSPITMTDRGDGTVGITYPEKVTITAPAAQDGTTVTVDVSLAGLQTTASGTPDAVTYSSTGPQLSMTGKVGGSDTGTFSVSATNLATDSTYTSDGTAITLESTGSADRIDVAVDVAGQDGSTAKVAATMDSVSADTSGSFLGNAAAMQDLAKAVADGFTVDTSMSFGATRVSVDATDATGPTQVSVAATGGEFGLYMGADGLTYTVGMNGGTFGVSGAQIPIPDASIGFGEFLFDIGMPLVASPDPADFSFVARLVDFTMADGIWAMVDPGNQFPRDPATIIVDTSGTATLTTSIVDDAAMASLGEMPPGTLDSLTINALQLKLGGADVNGTGALTFDNTDLATFGGFPAPTGTINLTATGVNGLIDKLVAMGLVPQDQAIGARMMLAMFATVATDGSDSLTSKIEFRDKSLFVNGQQLQ